MSVMGDIYHNLQRIKGHKSRETKSMTRKLSKEVNKCNRGFQRMDRILNRTKVLIDEEQEFLAERRKIKEAEMEAEALRKAAQEAKYEAA